MTNPTHSVITPEGQTEVPLTAEELAAQAAGVPNFTIGYSWRNIQDQAQVLLDASDITFSRALEAGVTWPQTWKDFRTALRAIISAPNGDPTQPLPARPAAYP